MPEIIPTEEVVSLKKRIEELESSQPQTIKNEETSKLEKPRRIDFVISAMLQDDSMIEGFYIPGKSLGISEFRRSFPLKCNATGSSYTTGFELDEIYYNDAIPNEQKESYQKDVRTARKWLEKSYGSLDSSRVDFWKSKKILVDDLEKIYTTEKDEDLILYYNILGGGYPDIGRNYDEAKRYNKQLYVSVRAEEAERKASFRKTGLAAKSALQEISNKWSIEDTLYLCYYLTPKGEHGHTKSTPKDHVILDLEDFIDGVDTKVEKKKRPQEFLDAISLYKNDKDRLKIEGLFNAAIYFGFIIYQQKEKTFVNKSTGFPYGSLKKDAVDKLLNPQNIEELSWLKRKVEQEKWIK